MLLRLLLYLIRALALPVLYLPAEREAYGSVTDGYTTQEAPGAPRCSGGLEGSVTLPGAQF